MISSDEVRTWIIAWFESHSSAPPGGILPSDNYFEKGWIDSLGFISFVSEIEEHFDVQFSNDEFQNREFSTIEGLSAIIAAKHGKR